MKLITHKMCPFAQKAWIGLEVCFIPYDFEEIPLYGANGKPDWFLALNPKGTVPTLVDGTTVWTDSDDFLDYLEQGEGSCHHEWRYDLINKRLLPVAKQVVLEGNSMDELQSILKEIDKHEVIQNTNDLSVAHCHAFPFLWRLDQDGRIDAARFPNIDNWLRSCEFQPEVVKTIQPEWWWWW